MLKNDSLTAASFVLSLLAIVFSVANFNFSPSTDTFVGIMAGLIGVCATIMVGFQIFNSIDTRNKLQEIEKLQVNLQKEIEKTKNERVQSEGKVQSYLYRAHGISLAEKQPFTAYELLFRSLEEALQYCSPEEIRRIINDIKVVSIQISKKIQNKETVNTACSVELKDMHPDNLEKYKLYPLIRKEYISIYSTMENSTSGLKFKIINEL